MSKQLVDLLLKDKIISQTQYNESVYAARGGRGHVRYLIEQKYVAENKLLYYLSQKFSLPSINLAKFDVSPEVIRLVPGDLARKVQAIPIQSSKGTLVMAVCDPANLAALEDVKFVTKLNVEVVLTTFSAFEAAGQRYYGGSGAGASNQTGTNLGATLETIKKEGSAVQEELGSGIEVVQVHDIDSGTSEQDAPVIQVVNGILTEAIRRMVSDIHIEPYEKRMRVRMRVDGTLSEVAQIPIEMKRAVVARLKILSRMDIAEQRVPQDGRIKLRYGGSDLDLRVSTMPTLYGEKVVLRVLNKGNLQLDLKKLGFDTKQFEIFKKGINAPNGMVLVTGPTGSGKTTTLYSALLELNKISDNLSTVEDPVEYNLEGINQVQVQNDIGLNFPSILRTFLRQDPDIILVGEIRDYETAEVAVQAALTGHLVLSTLHTNDAPSSITRLINMGLEPFLVVASVNTIVAQRLIRTLCQRCRVEQNIPVDRLIQIGFPAETAGQVRCFVGKGCTACGGTGYKGRAPVFEVFDFDQKLKEMLLAGQSVLEIRKQAIRDGMKTLRMSALAKVAEGKTSLEEAVAMTMES